MKMHNLSYSIAMVQIDNLIDTWFHLLKIKWELCTTSPCRLSYSLFCVTVCIKYSEI